jgi:hypothetical protein
MSSADLCNVLRVRNVGQQRETGYRNALAARGGYEENQRIQSNNPQNIRYPQPRA